MSDPIHIISLGAGVQSSTMALMAAAGEITPMPTAAVFADTQAEPASVYKWLDWLEKQLPFPVIRATAGSLTDCSLKLKEFKSKPGKFWAKSLIPAFIKNADGTRGIMGRQCTFDYKVVQLERASRQIALKEVRAWQRELRQRRFTCKMLSLGSYTIPDPIVVQWIGISLDEVQRMKSARKPYIKHRWPLIEKEMKRHDCLRWMEAHGYPKPPRSACVYCPFHSNAEWRRLRDEEPAEFERAVKFEIDLQAVKAVTDNKAGKPFLHRSCVPLSEVDLSTDTERGQGLLAGFGNECEGMCGV